MRLTDAIKSYFSRYDDEDEEPSAEKQNAEKQNLKKVYKKKKKKKKKPIPAGSYSKSARKQYEEALEEAGEY